MITILQESAFATDSFSLYKTDTINDAVKIHNVSNGYGAYVFYGCKNDYKVPIYVGKAGTFNQNGTMKKQGIKERLTKKQGGMSRKDYFRQIIEENDYEYLYFIWMETYKNGEGSPPFLAEAKLLWSYLAEYKQLPKLNKAM